MTWLLIAGIGVGTLVIRASFILGVSPSALDRVARIRRFIPIAALTALVVPALLPKGEEPIYARGIAAAVAGAIAFRFKNTFLTVAVGIALLLLLR